MVRKGSVLWRRLMEECVLGLNGIFSHADRPMNVQKFQSKDKFIDAGFTLRQNKTAVRYSCLVTANIGIYQKLLNKSLETLTIQLRGKTGSAFRSSPYAAF